MDHVYTSPGAVPQPQVDLRPFMWSAAVGALETHDITPYQTAWTQMVSRLGSDQAVQNLQLPTPSFFARDINNPIAITFDMQEYLQGLWLAEWALANPDQAVNITWFYFSPLTVRIAQAWMSTNVQAGPTQPPLQPPPIIK